MRKEELLLDLSLLYEDEVKLIQGSIEEECVDLTLGEIPLEGPIKFAIEIKKISEDIYLSGKAEASFYFPCSRCLEDVFLQIHGTIQALFLPAKSEKNELYRDFDSYENVIYYTDLKIDLYERILEAISVEIPERILCSESCKGLCPFCGENLNNDVEHTCSEKEDFFLFNSKFSGLNNLNKNNLHKKSGGN